MINLYLLGVLSPVLAITKTNDSSSFGILLWSQTVTNVVSKSEYASLLDWPISNILITQTTASRPSSKGSSGHVHACRGHPRTVRCPCCSSCILPHPRCSTLFRGKKHNVLRKRTDGSASSLWLFPAICLPSQGPSPSSSEDWHFGRLRRPNPRAWDNPRGWQSAVPESAIDVDTVEARTGASKPSAGLWKRESWNRIHEVDEKEKEKEKEVSSSSSSSSHGM